MNFTVYDELRLCDFCFSKQEEIIAMIGIRLGQDENFLEALNEQAKESLQNDALEVTDRSIAEKANDLLQEKAEWLADRIKVYLEFNVEY